MKRILCAMILIVIVCLLSACSLTKEQTDNTESIAPTQSVSVNQEPTASSTEQSNSTEYLSPTQTVPPTEQSQPTEEDKIDYGTELFSRLTEPFSFTSGVGAWSTVLQIYSDGSFSGNFHDSDMGVIGDGYPGGTKYYCDFSGEFGELDKINDYTYSMRMMSIEYEDEPDTEEIIDLTLYKFTTAYGLDEADEVIIYTPDAPISELPEGFLSWTSRLIKPSGETLGYYGLYNVNEEEGFVSQNQ